MVLMWLGSPKRSTCACQTLITKGEVQAAEAPIQAALLTVGWSVHGEDSNYRAVTNRWLLRQRIFQVRARARVCVCVLVVCACVRACVCTP